jgi:conjugative relaxase-like TrwC/TraI family protein
MLSLVNLDGGRADYYLARGKVEYLQGEGGEGRWYGKGCAALGLTGTVKEQDFRSLFAGFLRGEKLVKSAGTEKHIPGKDACFSAPKSVSAWYAVADPKLRKAIESCQARAVRRGLDYLEAEATVCRTGKAGRQRERAGMVAALWQHGTSRSEDPELHHHATIFNVGVLGRGGTRTTVQELPFFHKMAAGAVYRAELARLLEQKLGLTVRRVQSWFEIEGVPEELLEHWSKRSAAIAEEVDRKGLSGAEGKAIAALSTREKKKPTPMGRLFESWRAQARRFGFTQESVPVGAVKERDVKKETSEAVALSLVNVTQDASHFAKRDLVREVATEAQGRGLSATQVVAAVEDTLERSPEVVRLGTVRHEPRFTTREVFAVEEQLLALARSARGKNPHVVREALIERAIREAEGEASTKAGKEVRMTDEQRAAVFRFTRGDDQIAVLTGDAGTGKTFALSAARKAFELEGYRCVGVALARKAAKGLEEGAGIKSTSVARLLLDLDLGLLDQARHHLLQIGRALVRGVHEDFRGTRWQRFLPRGISPQAFDPVKIDAKTVLFVDEAAMVGVKHMEQLLRQTLERGGKVCLVGDAKQLQPVEGAQCFSALARVLGEARLTQIVRQKNEEDRKAVRALSRGEAKEALRSYAERGLVDVADTQKAAMRQMIADWRFHGVRNPKENLLLCSTNQEREALNRMAQAAMKSSGRLGRKSARVGVETIHEGDRVAFTMNSKALGVENGSTGTVLRIGRKKITRKTFHGKQFRSLWSMLKYAEKVRADKTLHVTVRLDSGKVVDIPLDRYEHLRLGYCLTTHSAQGMTADRAFLLTGGHMTSREMVYVQASRSKEETRIYTDRMQAGDQLAELVKKAARPRPKEMAHDLLPQTDEPRKEISR